MPLIALWKSAPETVAQLNIEQIVTSAGDGILKDSSICSAELREYLAGIASTKLASYVEHCLNTSFNKSGLVLQDLINELGRRLEYKAENGRYQGVKDSIGFDGLWLSPNGHSMIVEVKTTDAYRISLDSIAEYRRKLGDSGKLGAKSSILIVVGREDTGELEAQIRGSRHAWDIRLISADALIKLVELKEDTEDADTGFKIRSLLAPMEYTRLDAMIDVMFTTAKDVDSSKEAEMATVVENGSQGESDSQIKVSEDKNDWQAVDSHVVTEIHLLQGKRDQVVAALTRAKGIVYIKKSRALFWDAAHTKRLVCTLSKRYEKKSANPYWFAYHPKWQSFLNEGNDCYLVLACMDLPFAFTIPLQIVSSILPALNTTTRDDGQVYWHMNITEVLAGCYAVLLPKRSDMLIIDSYKIQITQSQV